MFEWDAFRGVTLRALRIDYIAPQVCELIASSSGSSAAESALLDILPVTRMAGPTNLQVSVDGAGVVTLTWTGRDYIFAYAVYAGPTVDGPFVVHTANLLSASFSYSPGPGTYFFKVTGIEPNFGETFPSETVGPVTVT